MMQESEVKRTREKLAVDIRRQQRAELFQESRKKAQEREEGDGEGEGEKKRAIVVDPRFHALISTALDTTYPPHALPDYCALLRNPDPPTRHQAVIAVRKIVSQRDSSSAIQQVVDSGAIPILLQLMREEEYPQLQLQSCWIITNIASGNSAQCESIVEKGCIDALLALLYRPAPFLAEQALWGIGNIAGDCPRLRDQVLAKGGLDCLVRIIQSGQSPLPVVRQAAWALSNLCRGAPLPKYELVRAGIPALCRAVVGGAGEELQDALWAIASHSEGLKSKVQRVLEVQGFVGALVGLCLRGEYRELVPCLRVLGNISNGNEGQTQTLLDNNCLRLLEGLLEHERRGIRREACWILSNICAGTRRQVGQVVARPELLLRVALLFATDHNDVKREVCYVFGNMCQFGDPLPLFALFQELRVLEAFIAVLADDSDPKLLENALMNLYDILALGERVEQPNPFLRVLEGTAGCLQRLEVLQRHDSGEIYRLVIKIFQRFFSLEDEALF